jgi:hypothetical protein
MLALILAAQVFAPHAAKTARVIIVLMIAVILIFGRRLLYLLAYGLIILFAVAVLVGAVTLAHIMHGLSRRPCAARVSRTVGGTTDCDLTTPK